MLKQFGTHIYLGPWLISPLGIHTFIIRIDCFPITFTDLKGLGLSAGFPADDLLVLEKCSFPFRLRDHLSVGYFTDRFLRSLMGFSQLDFRSIGGTYSGLETSFPFLGKHFSSFSL